MNRLQMSAITDSYLDSLEKLSDVLDDCLSLSISSDKVPEKSKYLCAICNCPYSEPRLLPCLHTFCSKCLQNLCNNGSQDKLNKNDASSSSLFENIKPNSNPKNSPSFSSTSDYDTQKSSAASFGINNSKCTKDQLFKEKCVISCPTCSSKVTIPEEGVKKLPINNLLLHQISESILTKDTLYVYCGLCSTDVNAVAYCEQCVIHLCSFCFEAHKRQRKTVSHNVHSLQQEKCKDLVIPMKKIFCLDHPESTIEFFCHTCSGTLCISCYIFKHQGHQCKSISDAANEKVDALNTCLMEVKPQLTNLRKAVSDVQSMGKQLDVKVVSICEEINKFIDNYIAALEVHRFRLLKQVQKVQVGRQRVLRLQRIQLQQLIDDLSHWETFVTKLLAEASQAEMMHLMQIVNQRWQQLLCSKFRLEPCADDTLQFNPKQKGGLINGYMMQGTISSQFVSPNFCILKGSGLQCTRRGKVTHLLLITRDASGQPIMNGQENVHSYLSSKNNEQSTQLAVKITDRGDGSYLLTYILQECGDFLLFVMISGKQIKGSPFAINVKPSWRQHSGVFHCCSFCSSGGSKDASCACGGIIPGGYKGCGHGHSGHPGGQHWSCCGVLTKKSECTRALKITYEYTL